MELLLVLVQLIWHSISLVINGVLFLFCVGVIVGKIELTITWKK